MSELVVDDGRVAARRAEAHADAVVLKVVSLDQRLAGVLGDFNAHVAGVDGRSGKTEVQRTHQNGGAATILDRDAFKSCRRPRNIEHRPGRKRLRIELRAPRPVRRAVLHAH